MKKIVLRFQQFKLIFLMSIFKPIKLFRKKKHWVLLERGYDARDNACFFYKFLKEKHPDIKVYYIIDKRSADCVNVEADAVNYGSLKSYWVMALAEKIICTHYAMGLPGLNKKIFSFFGMNKRFYCLQHGVVMNFYPVFQYKVSALRMFFCGAKPEYDYMREAYGYPESNVKYTGLARYDNLHDVTTENTILLMPTWRMYIQDAEDLKKSDYFKSWQAVLSDEGLISLLKENGLKIVFYPHYEMQKYIDVFESKSDSVVIAAFDKYDVQTLLKEAKLLITDYSSVFFDFAYMEKPVVYFQFDREAFYGKHYEKGYFSFEKMGFGNVYESPEGVVDAIAHYIDNSFEMEEVFKKRVNEFFVLRDRHNCERIYDAITEG